MIKFFKKYGLTIVLGILLIAKTSPASADWINGLSIAEIYSGLPSANLVEDVVLNIMLWLLRLFTFIAVIGFVVNGIMYIMAGGDPGLADKAKKGVTFSIIGIAVGLAGYIVIAQIDELLAY